MKKKTQLHFSRGLIFVVLWIFSLSILLAQNLTISGVVTDTENEVLTGVTIKVQGRESHGTITDINGQFSLPDVASNEKLEISYVGMKTQIVDVAGRTLINIVLEEDTEMLEEVQVVAFGKQKNLM